jgi:hypothetical protein
MLLVAFYVHHKPCNHNVTWVLDGMHFLRLGRNKMAATIIAQQYIDSVIVEKCPWCKMTIPSNRTFLKQKPIGPPVYAVWQGWKQKVIGMNKGAPIPPPIAREWIDNDSL